MSSGKWRPFCLALKALNISLSYEHRKHCIHQTESSFVKFKAFGISRYCKRRFADSAPGGMKMVGMLLQLI